MMIHIYAVVLAVVLLIGALAAIIICICVDIVPIIKSRGSTLVSRDSVTQEQTRMLKKSLQRKKLTSSASADFIDRRKTRAQAILKAERPRFGSTPLALLSGEDEKNSESVEFKTTTVIIEALPRSSLAENNNNNDVTKHDSDVTNQLSSAVENESPVDSKKVQPRNENSYTESSTLNSPDGQLMKRSGSSPNVAGRRTKSADLLEAGMDVRTGAMTYNARDQRLNFEKEMQPRSYPNSPNIRSSRCIQVKEDDAKNLRQDQSPAAREISRGENLPKGSVRSKGYAPYGNSPPGTGNLEGGDFRRDGCGGYPPDLKNVHTGKNGEPPNCDSHYCKWCQIERERNLKGRTHERHLPFRRTESFPENYGMNSSPRLYQKHMRRQRSFDEDEAAKLTRGFPYDHNKYCKNPHRGYSPCPDCFHSNHQMYYPYGYHDERVSPDSLQYQGISGMGNPPKCGNTQLPGPPAPLTSSSSSSTSSGSSSRFRHLRQPLEDIQEVASDCYVMREAEVTSTIDSRELDSSPDDETMPKSTDNSIMSVSPMLPPDKQTHVVSVSGS